MFRKSAIAVLAASTILAGAASAQAQVAIPLMPGAEANQEEMVAPIFRLTLDNGWSFECGRESGKSAMTRGEFITLTSKASRFKGAHIYFQGDHEREGASHHYVRGDIFMEKPERTIEAGWGGIIALPSETNGQHIYIHLRDLGPACGSAKDNPHNKILTRGEKASGWARIFAIQVLPEQPY